MISEQKEDYALSGSRSINHLSILANINIDTPYQNNVKNISFRKDLKTNSNIIRITKKISRDKSKLVNINVNKYPTDQIAFIEAIYKFCEIYKDKYTSTDFKRLFEVLQSRWPDQFAK